MDTLYNQKKVLKFEMTSQTTTPMGTYETLFKYE